MEGRYRGAAFLCVWIVKFGGAQSIHTNIITHYLSFCKSFHHFLYTFVEKIYFFATFDNASLAAACDASFLDRPFPVPKTIPSRITEIVKVGKLAVPSFLISLYTN